MGSDGETPSQNNGEFNPQIALQWAINKQRAYLISDIVGHPQGSPSIEELVHMNPSLSESAILEHLDALLQVGIVEVSEHKSEQHIRNFSYQFYSLTPEARDLFDKNGLFPAEAWQRQYHSVDKSQRLKRIESIPRSPE